MTQDGSIIQSGRGKTLQGLIGSTQPLGHQSSLEIILTHGDYFPKAYGIKLKIYFTEKLPTTTPTSSTVVPIPKWQCGVPPLATRIIGGSPAIDGEIPYQALIVRSTNYYDKLCGATLVSEWHVVTSVQCTYIPFKVIVGAVNPTPATAIVLDYETITIHESYTTTTSKSTFQNFC